jgi:thiosulfate dehydrogenase [quinone] large subunit
VIERLVDALGVRGEPGRVPAVALLPLRLFFGATFIYAGLQKLTDPQFFSPTAPGFIGRQMSGFVRGGSPLSPLLTHLAVPHAAQFGALIAFCELWVGLSTLLGLLSRLGALGGLAISLTFYLTATWTVHPYFLGADLPYALGWLTLLLAGPGPYSLDAYFFGRALHARAARALTPARKGRPNPAPLPLTQDPVARGAFMRGLGTAVAVVVGGGIVGGLVKLRTPNKVFAGPSQNLSSGPAPASTPPASGATAAPASAPTGTTLLGSVRGMPVNSAAQYTDPGSGDPALLIRMPDGHFVAYDAVCTHAGCTVQYDPTQREIVCPCHGAVYDPAHGAQVLAGPAPQPLATLHVSVDARGNAYAERSSGGSVSPATGG